MSGETKLARPIVPVRHQLNNIQEVKQAMIQACKIMDNSGLVEGFGHVSSRIPGTDNILVTTRRALRFVEEKDLVIVDSNGKVVEGNSIPFIEIFLHLGVYQKRKDVGAICRFHTETTTVFGVLNKSIRPVHALGYLVGPEVKVLSSPDLGYKTDIGQKIGNLISDSYGIIFRGNGALTVGTNVIDACARALMLDESAKIQYKALLLGKPEYLTIDEMNTRNEDYWGKTDYDVYYRIWEYHLSKVK